MSTPCSIHVPSGLTDLRAAAVAAKTGFEKKNKLLEASYEQARIEMIDELAPFTGAVKHLVASERWAAFVKMIDSSITIPYPQFRPICLIGLTGILLNMDK